MMSGAVVAIAARGEGPATLHDLREWSARTLRSLEHHDARHQSAATPAAPVLAQPSQARSGSFPASSPVVPRAPAADAPCPVDPAPGDPCAELLAPFLAKGHAATIPTIAVETLPRARPAVVARRHHPRTAPSTPPAAPPAPPPDADAEDEPRTPPSKAGKPELEVPPPRGRPFIAPEVTAENDLR